MAAEQGPNVLFCMPNGSRIILLISVPALGAEHRHASEAWRRGAQGYGQTDTAHHTILLTQAQMEGSGVGG
jgi:hypothetical protein